MKTQINIPLFEKRLKLSYYMFWIYLILLVVVFELLTSIHGFFADNGQLVYELETITILITAGAIPLALKLFGKNTAGLREHESVTFVLAEYQKWSSIRLLILYMCFIYMYYLI